MTVTVTIRRARTRSGASARQGAFTVVESGFAELSGSEALSKTPTKRIDMTFFNLFKLQGAFLDFRPNQLSDASCARASLSRKRELPAAAKLRRTNRR